MRNLGLLLLLFCSTMFACQYPNRSFCVDSKLGLGIYYGNLGSYEAEASSIGGYWTFNIDYYQKWFYASIDFLMSFANAKITYNMDNTAHTRYETDYGLLGKFKIGTTLGSLHDPTFIYIALPIIDRHNLGMDGPNELDLFYQQRGAFLNTMVMSGIGVFNRTMIAHGFGIESGLEIAFNLYRLYAGYGFNEIRFFDGGQRYEANIGMVYRRNYGHSIVMSTYESIDFYAKLKAIYYNNNIVRLNHGDLGSIEYPKTHDFVILFEMGIYIGF